MEFFIKPEMFFSGTFLLRFYQVYAKPLISYGIFVYGCAYKSNLSKIFIMQKQILRTISFLREFDHITEKFSQHSIDTVFDLFLDTVFKEVIYQTLGKSPLKFLNFNQLNNWKQTRARILRMLRLKSVRSNCLLQPVSVKVLKFYNVFRLIVFFQRT